MALSSGNLVFEALLEGTAGYVGLFVAPEEGFRRGIEFGFCLF